MDRVILHVDINSCYANIECLYHPELAGLPVAVGGNAEMRHGIILAKNQEAKAFGVQTGEALWQARGKCPTLVILPPQYGLYLRFSRLTREIYQTYTDRVEPFGLDEAWLDVTGCADGKALAEEIRERVKAELGITVSIGVSFNKVFAKLGSDYKKPDAVTVISQDNFRDLVWPLPVGNLLYVGRSTGRRLLRFGIPTIGDLAQTDPRLLAGWFGKWGVMLHLFASGEDEAPVAFSNARTVVKSIGNSTTTPRDMENDEDASLVFCSLAESVAERLREGGFLAQTVQIYLRDRELSALERQIRLPQPTCLATELHRAAMKLLRVHYPWPKPLRSIGLRAAELLPASLPKQLTLLEDAAYRDREEKLERMADTLRRRFGPTAVVRAAVLADPVLGQVHSPGVSLPGDGFSPKSF